MFLSSCGMRLAGVRVAGCFEVAAIEAANFIAVFVDDDAPDLDALVKGAVDCMQRGDDVSACRYHGEGFPTCFIISAVA